VRQEYNVIFNNSNIYCVSELIISCDGSKEFWTFDCFINYAFCLDNEVGNAFQSSYLFKQKLNSQLKI
jgi:hypothetical protein